MLERLVPFNYVRKLLHIVVEKQKKKEIDCGFLYSGGEGSGKSNLILNNIDILDQLRGTTTPVNQITFNLDEFSKAAYIGVTRRKILTLDESKELEATNWQDKKVKAFKRFITRARKAGHIYNIAFPNPISMLGYLRDDKIFAIFLCWCMETSKGTRYYVNVYSRDNFRLLLQEFEKKNYDKSIHAILKSNRHNFCAEVPRYEGPLWEAYNVKKDKDVDDAHFEFWEAVGAKAKDAGLLTPKKAASLLGLSANRLADLRRAGKLKPAVVTPGGQARYSLEEIENYQKSTIGATNGFTSTHTVKGAASQQEEEVKLE